MNTLTQVNREETQTIALSFVEWFWAHEEEEIPLTEEQMHPDYEWPQDNS